MRRGFARRAAALLAAALLAPVAVSGCSVRMIGAPKGDTTLYATFEDTQNLVPGHSVQIGDVKVGSVKEVRLVAGYRSKVTMTIQNRYKIPKGTSAEVAVTSLLGENFVRLSLPPGVTMSSGQAMASGEEIAKTSIQPQFEQVIGRAGPMLDALAGDDVAAVVNAGATALGGNGEKLNTMIAKSSDLVKIFADQRAELASSMDRLAKLGRSLAKGDDELGRLPGELAKTTRMLDENKTQILKTVDRLTAMARQLNDKVLEGRVQRLKGMLLKLDPVMAQLGKDRTRLTNLIKAAGIVAERVPKATYDGQFLFYPLVKFMTEDGKLYPQSSSMTPVSLPDGIDKALPEIDQVVRSGR